MTISLPVPRGRFDWSSMSLDTDTILFDLMCAHDPEPPAPDVVRAWCARFPAHARAIRAHVAAWVRSDLARNRVPLHYRAR